MSEVAARQEIDALRREFRRQVRESVIAPARDRLDRYVAALQKTVAELDELGEGTAGGAEGEATEATRSAIELRYLYVDRFQARFGEQLFDDADLIRAELFLELDTRLEPASFPEVVRMAVDGSAPTAPDLVRPPWFRRVVARARRPVEREVPVAALADLFMADLGRRLEAALNDIARLTAVAIADIRRELHAHTDLAGDDAEPTMGLEAAAARAADTLEAAAEATEDEFGEALTAADGVVPDRSAGAMREQSASRRARVLDDWSDFETALVANVASEAVLARALASMEASSTSAARELEAIREHRGFEPLSRLAEGLAELRAAVSDELDRDAMQALEELATHAGRLFAAELPRLAALRPRIVEQVEGLVEELAAVPERVPDDLHISDHPVPEIPSRPRKLQLREAPMEELLATACSGALPRWLEKSVETASEELTALEAELERMRNAVEFQLRAPLRGGFEGQEIRDLVDGIMDRTVAQLQELRGQGLASIDDLVRGLEDRTREEAEALRYAVANREFLRIHSEIAGEQAVRHLSTGLGRARDAAGEAGRGARWAWGLGRRGVAAVRAWAQRQLGVGEVEREEMLESLEQSLIGEDQQVVALPAMYRQLFDVEGDVPWDELLVPREEELAVIRRAYDRWLEDRSASVAIIGEKGSGKTTLIRLAEKEVLADARLVRTTLGRATDDPAQLDERLAAAFGLEGSGSVVEQINAQPPAVAVVEDLHHLFVRALGGFEALEAFLETVAATRENVLWVVTVDEYAWRYLSRVVGLESHFIHEVNTTSLPPAKLEQAIMARHSVSGFALRFETREAEVDDGRWARLLGREAKGELTRKESQRRRFFRDLAAIAEGNIVLALFYWLRSIRRIDEHALVLGDPEMMELEFLDRLPLEQLHTIAAIILHGGLSGPDHERVFQLTSVESRLQLAALADAHMVFLSDDGEYKINKVLYRPFIRMLSARNVF